MDQATLETREATIRDIINLRTEQAWRRRTGTRDQPNVGDIGVAAYAEYDGNPQAMRRGKRVLAQVRSILQQQLGGHANLNVPFASHISAGTHGCCQQTQAASP